jgi:selenocysteine-specific elongation factor
VIVATAGHVDHGKTALIRQLTGVETDRLEEEKRRGLSINLGYAYLPTDNGLPIGFIDVPGHRRFINTMIAGSSGIDLAMLVVAADDGPMPQTREHLDVLRLLGVPSVVLVISKIDRVDMGRVAEVTAQVRELVENEGLPVESVFPVSNIEGTGIPQLKAFLVDAAKGQQTTAATGEFRLSIDRAFSLKGAGLVVTGTCTAGRITVGDSLKLLPQEKTLRVRALHVQDRSAEIAQAGQRCAVNLSGDIEKEAIHRGDWLVGPGSGPTTQRFDGKISLLRDAPFSPRQLSPVKLYLGARRVAAKLYYLQAADSDLRGQEQLAQFILDSPISCVHGERFLLRDDSETYLLGGGRVITPRGVRSGKSRDKRLQYLAALDQADPLQALATLAIEQGQLVNRDEYCQMWNIPVSQLANLPAQLRAFAVEGKNWIVSDARWRDAGESILRFLDQWHAQNPSASGIKLTALQQALGGQIESVLLVASLTEQIKLQACELKQGVINLPGREAVVPQEEQQHWITLNNLLSQRDKDIPVLSEIAEVTGINKAIWESVARAAARQGRLHRLSDNRYAQPKLLLDLAQQALRLHRAGESLTVIAFKKEINTGRNLAVEVLEYFDSIRFTQRKGDARVILDAEVPPRVFSS